MTNDLIEKKLDKIIALLAVQGKDDEQKLRTLRGMEYSYSEISKLLGIPEGTLKTWGSKKSKEPR